MIIQDYSKCCTVFQHSRIKSIINKHHNKFYGKTTQIFLFYDIIIVQYDFLEAHGQNPEDGSFHPALIAAGLLLLGLEHS